MDIETARARIEAINTILASGIVRVSTPSGTRENDLEALSKERDRLQSALNAATRGSRTRRGRFA